MGAVTEFSIASGWLLSQVASVVGRKVEAGARPGLEVHVLADKEA
jgi:hypothetical protein